jgi:hypothetical protein
LIINLAKRIQEFSKIIKGFCPGFMSLIKGASFEKTSVGGGLRVNATQGFRTRLETYNCRLGTI